MSEMPQVYRTKGMTEAELKAEHRYRYNERLGITGVFDHPTADQHNMAVIEADRAIAQLRKLKKISRSEKLSNAFDALRESLNTTNEPETDQTDHQCTPTLIQMEHF